MSTIPSNFPDALSFDLMKRTFKDIYAGKEPFPCSEDCPETCDGEHYMDFDKPFPDIFK